MKVSKKRVLKVVIAAVVAIILFAILAVLIRTLLLPRLPKQWQSNLVWLGTTLLTTIAVLASLAELTGYSLRDLFSSQYPEMPKNYGIKILSPSREEPTVEIGKWFRLTGTFEETPPSGRVKLFKLPPSGNYWPLIDIEIDFNYGDYREKKWRAEIPVRDGEPGDEVEYIVAILGDEGLTQWIDYTNLPNGERYGIRGNPFDDTIVCDRVTVILD